MDIIEVRDLKKSYKKFEAVKGISFTVKEGEVFGILGPNGAGKTTTLEIIECLKRPSAGECIVLGFNSNNAADAIEIKKRIGVQLQTSEYLDLLDLSELIHLFAGLYGMSADPIALLKRVDLESKAKNYFKELSGGQKQRFTIATALVNKPKILFLDEPTTGLDPHARRNLWELIKEINAEGITVILTTHYMEEAEFLCHRVAIMDQGKILRLGEPQKMIADIGANSQLSFFVQEKLDPSFFAGMQGITNCIMELPKVTLEISNIEILPGIIEKLKKERVGYSLLNLRTATLEDVYLQLTGHAYEGTD